MQSAFASARQVPFAVALAATMCVAGCFGNAPNYEEASVAELHDAMQRGELTAEQLVHWYVDRIEDVDRGGPALNSIIEVNPDALTIARSLDDEWRRSGPRGPLHGIPVVLKANIDTADAMATSAGSLVLAGHVPPRDAFLVSRLRDAGAVILGKANLSEWANFRSTHSTSGWSSVGGQTRNPYDPTRNPCGSSSGSAVAVAANLAVVAVGTETDGSIVCPAGINGIVGVKPTVGLVSRSGIIPIAATQDTAGPMARSVRDAAILLTAMTGRDPDDAATLASADDRVDYAAGLAADGLAGRRIGVLRVHAGAGAPPAVAAILAGSVDLIRAQGAEIVDDIELDTAGVGDAEYQVLLYEFKAGLEDYLAKSNAPVRSLDEIIAFNEANADTVMPHFGQDILVAANSLGADDREANAPDGLDNDAYREALAKSRDVMRAALDATFDEHRLDALIAITNGPAWKTDHVTGDHFSIGSSSFAAVSGYPNVSVPAGFVAGLPIGLSFIGRAWSEQALLNLAYAFEQASDARRAPSAAARPAAP
ncbi:MAG TPA: amidase [Woeseiaceae bacterium]|nr:amidase [Woeseiaceae bacterium]